MKTRTMKDVSRSIRMAGQKFDPKEMMREAASEAEVALRQALEKVARKYGGKVSTGRPEISNSEFGGTWTIYFEAPWN